MRRRLLPRSLALAGAALSLLAAVSAASVTLFGDRAAINSNPGESTSASGSWSGPGVAPANSSNQQTQLAAPGGHVAAGNSDQAGVPGTTIQSAGPSIFEQQAHAQQPILQISAGPTTFEQQIRSQAPRPKSGPGPITRGPGLALH